MKLLLLFRSLSGQFIYFSWGYCSKGYSLNWDEERQAATGNLLSHHCLEKLFFVVMLNTKAAFPSPPPPVFLLILFCEGLAVGPLYLLPSNILSQQTWWSPRTQSVCKYYRLLQCLLTFTDIQIVEGAPWAYKSLSHGCFFLLYLVFPESIKLNNQIMLGITKWSLVSMHRMKCLKNCLLAGVSRLQSKQFVDLDFHLK